MWVEKGIVLCEFWKVLSQKTFQTRSVKILFNAKEIWLLVKTYKTGVLT